jgi:hypothetical protein
MSRGPLEVSRDKGGRNDWPSRVTELPPDPAPLRPPGSAFSLSTLTLAQTLLTRAVHARRAGMMRFEPSDDELRQIRQTFPQADLHEALRRLDVAMRALHDVTPLAAVDAVADEQADCWRVDGVVVSRPLVLGEYIDVKGESDGRVGVHPLFRLRVCAPGAR